MVNSQSGAWRNSTIWNLQVIFFGSAILYFGRSIFIPFSFGVLISFVLYPTCRWLEVKGLRRVWAIGLALFVLALVGSGIILLLVFQFQLFLKEWPAIEEKARTVLVQISQVVWENLNLSPEGKKSFMASLTTQSGAGFVGVLKSTLASSLSSMVLLFLVPVYAALILYSREYWLKVLVHVFKYERDDELRQIIRMSVDTYFKFIRGMALVYLIVGSLNSLGLLILGVPNPIFFGFTASILTIVPYVGIIIGALLPIAIAWITYDSIWYPLGIVGIFAFVQYLEANIIFPFAVSQKLNVNTLIMLLVIFAGGILWGLSGMILFVPFIGILKLIADQNPDWKSLSMILGSQR